MAGAFLVAINSKYAVYGWVCFLLANIVMIVFSVESGLYGILCQQLIFMGASVLGLWKSNDAKKT